jgi:hypothetical protein
MRYLDTEQGRFLSRDPMGIWYDSLALGNGYSYVGNNPLNQRDPTGEHPCLSVALAGFGVGCISGSLSSAIGWFCGTTSFGEVVQDCVCSGLQGAATSLGACIGTQMGNPVWGACIGSAAGALISTFCNLLGNHVRGQTITTTAAKEVFKGAVSTALGCLGGVENKTKQEIQLHLVNVAVGVWSKVLDML